MKELLFFVFVLCFSIGFTILYIDMDKGFLAAASAALGIVSLIGVVWSGKEYFMKKSKKST